MKKTFLSLLCLAAAAMTFTACSDIDDFEPNRGNNGKGMTIIAENPDVENDTRTMMGYEGNTIVPMWGQDDELHIAGMNKIEMIYFMRAEEQPATSKTAVFKEKNDGEFNNYIKGCEKFYAIHTSNDINDVTTLLENNIVSIVSKRYGVFIGNEEDVKKEQVPLKNDILFSDAMTYDNNATTEIKPRFKRYTAVIRINLKDETPDGVCKSDKIASVNISNDNQKDYFAGKIEFNIETGEIKKNTSVEFSSTISFDGCEFNKPFFISTLPVHLVQGDTISFDISTVNGGLFKKTIKLDDKGLNIESGKITTINVSFNEENVKQKPIADPTPDPSIDPTYTPRSGVITMKDGHYGRLTEKMLAEAMTADAKIKVTGNMNAFDFNSLLKLIGPRSISTLDNFTIDLSEADIIGGDGSGFVLNGLFYKIEKNNLLPIYMFYGNISKQIDRLILPNSAEEIEYRMFQSYKVKELVIGTGIKKIAESAIMMNNPTGQTASIYILVDPDTNPVIENEFQFKGGLNLVLNKKWKGHANGPQAGNLRWKGITWRSINYCDANGNIIKETESGAVLPDVIYSGNVL